MLSFFSPSSKCSLFHNSNVFGSSVIHILYTGCAKIKKNNSGAKRLMFWLAPFSLRFCGRVVFGTFRSMFHISECACVEVSKQLVMRFRPA